MDLLASLVDTSRMEEHDLNSVRSGFLDGIHDKPSRAVPGTDPKFYASGYAFGAELVELMRWSHEVQADIDRVG